MPDLVAQQASSEHLLDVDGVGPVVDLLGEVIDVDVVSVRATVDSAGGSLDLGEGLSISVEGGAFPSPIDLEVMVVNLPLDEFATNPPILTFYVLSTDVAVEPISPVVLELPVPSSELAVAAFENGEWLPVEIASGSTTVIEFDHFSDQVRAILRPDADTVPRSDVAIDDARLHAYEDAADAFVFCVGVLEALARGWEFGGEDRALSTLSPEGSTFLDTGVRGCTVVLIHKLTPEGEVVTVECVGDEVGRGLGVLEAIDTCLVTDEEWVEAAATAVGDAIAGREDPPAPSQDEIDFETEIVRACLLEGRDAGWSRGRSELDCGVTTRRFHGDGTMAVTNEISCYEDMPFELTLFVDGRAFLVMQDPIPQVQRDPASNELVCDNGSPQTYPGEWSRSLLGGSVLVRVGSSDQDLEITLENEIATVAEEIDFGRQQAYFEFELVDAEYFNLIDEQS